MIKFLRKRNKGLLKVVSIYTLLTLLFQIASPTVTYALTGGPQQPEFQGFSQIDTGNMVDAFTGDFKYQIPLMVVPGPNGGYPINLTYTAGPSLEEEASWVGLGWNLNLGAINRQMRGIPDDFKQDPIIKENYIKPNTTVGVGLGMMFTLQEAYGADLATVGNIGIGVNSMFYMNNYTGFGYRNSISASFGLTQADNESSAGLSAGLSLNFDSNEGADVQPSFGLKSRDGQNSFGLNYGFGYSGRQGFQGHYLSASVSKHYTSDAQGALKADDTEDTYSYSFPFAVASGVPKTSLPMSGGNLALSLKLDLGGVDQQFKIPITLTGKFSRQAINPSFEKVTQFGYGLKYAGEAPTPKGNFLMDYNIEKDAPINVKLPNLPIPVSTHDIYSVQAAQLSLSFRNYRNDMGTFFEPGVFSETVGFDQASEIGTGTGFKFGVDPKISYALSYSGPWKGNSLSVSEKFAFRGDDDNLLLKDENGHQNKHFSYVKVSGEQTAEITGSGFRMSRAGGTFGPIKFPINSTDNSNMEFTDEELGDYDGPPPFDGQQQFTTSISPILGNQGFEDNINRREQRKNTLIEEKTQAQVLQNNNNKVFKGKHVSSTFISPSTSNPTYQIDTEYAYPVTAPHHIGEFTVLEPGGMRYTFGLPAYNKKQRDVVFAITVGENSDEDNLDKLIGYSGIDKRKNKQGRDQYFSSTELPPYTHSHLLTLITSPDYVDVDNNGPSDNDYGYFVKFNYYRQHQNYKWRTPYEANKANHNKGFYSSSLDNKATYTYGEKEIWYTHSIETNTHVAVFVMADRADGYGVAGSMGGIDPNQKLKCLKEIRLYAKTQIQNGVLPADPIKTVYFEYTYELCKNIPNNINNDGQSPGVSDNDKGKLTLKKVYFSYNGKKRGELNAYQFDYASNPDYAPMQSDRWGNYRADGGTNFGANEENPYVNQDESSAAIAQRNTDAGAWSISKITTPSNSVMEINYEPDDYAYVQDKAATQMFEIVGTGKDSEIELLDCEFTQSLNLPHDSKVRISKSYNKLYFKPEIDQATIAAMSSTQRDDYLQKHVSSLTDGWLYFKTWQRLQRPKNRTYWANDYVTGYAKINSSEYGWYEANGVYIPYVTVKDTDNDIIKNPIQLAGLQYLRYSRGDLNMPQTLNNGAEGAITMIMQTVTTVMQFMELLSGYYSYAKMNNYCKFIESGKPSFIKLVSPDSKKYGGGHRVKSIVVKDGWNEALLDQEEYRYKQDYYYQTIDGKSSGVAAYEPSIGNDENALKYPYFYSPDNKHNNDPAFLTEAPFNESYFPAPVVGYSRVLVRNDINYNDKLADPNIPDVKATGEAIKVSEFYTAKDFPVINEYTPADNVKNKLMVPIPLLGGIQITDYGYSQGYMIELNDMHGKPKADYVYAASAWEYDRSRLYKDAAFVSSKSYKYNTMEPYGANKKNRINPVVQVLNEAELIMPAVVGETAEIFSNLREDSGFSFSAGLQINGGVDPLPYTVFVTGYPSFDFSQNTARTSVTNKIIYRTGILMETEERMEGAVKTNTNLLYDAETMQPLLTVVTTDYDNHQNPAQDAPIYTYNIPSHWSYPGMKAAYKNYQTKIKADGITISGGFYPIPGANKYLQPGDEVDYYLDGTTYATHLWVDEVNSDNVKLINDAGVIFSSMLTGELAITKSGYRNMQNVTAGTIVSLNNPVGNNLPLFTAYNNEIYQNGQLNGVGPGDAMNKRMCVENKCDNSNIVPQFQVQFVQSLGNSYLEFPIYQCGGSSPNLDPRTIPCSWMFKFTNIGYGTIPFNDLEYNRIRLYCTNTGSMYAIYDSGNGESIIMGLEFGTNYPEGCAVDPILCMDGILDAKAVEFKNVWNYPGDYPVTSGMNNGWQTGQKGVWRAVRTNTYFIDRKQEGTEVAGNKSFIGRDGTYQKFSPFRWPQGNAENVQMASGWRWAAEVPDRGYSRSGQELESKNALGIYSSELFGFGNSLVTAVSANARYHEIGFESFERPGLKANYTGSNADIWNKLKNGQNHILFNAPAPAPQTSGAFSLTTEKSHSGLISLKSTASFLAILPIQFNMLNVSNFDPNYEGIQLVCGKKYILSFWYYNTGTSDIQALAYTSNTLSATGQVSQDETIEGWRKTTLEFMVPATTTTPFSVMLVNSGTVYIDDIRIHPVSASFKSFVYDPIRFNLKAELDDNNYATFYNYNQEGNLVQVKKETREGIKTIRYTNKYIKPNQPFQAPIDIPVE